MKTSTHSIINANQAVAQIAYKTNEVFPIYPITPASEMSELVEQWHAEQKSNAFGSSTSVFQMQSEAGVAGAMHGALQTGSLSSTFTASQGLLLMLPNMYKIAGELTPNVIHVATRSIATHALSIFGDHSDIMAVRQSGYAMLGSASVQEAHDFALISQAASLESSIPFVHFFDGFRTSHEINTIELIPDDVIQSLINQNKIKVHRNRALNPNKPVLRGTSQGADVFFQSREAINPFYDMCPDIVQSTMDNFALLTGRHYKLFDYAGHPEAEHIIISMASSTETIETTINQLNEKGKKYGLIKVRLFRPFSTKHLVQALPKSVKSIAVLDRTKEPGSSGEPLYLDVLQSISEAFQNNKLSTFPKIVGGRYGLSSKEFTPSMVNPIFNNLKEDQPKNNFTIGINDDVKNLSLDFSEVIKIKNNLYEAIFYQEKTEHDSFSNTLKLIAKKENTFVQGYTQCDYKKSNSYNTAHLRIGSTPIKAPYLIEEADFIGCQNVNFTLNDNTLHKLKFKGTLLINTSQTSKAFWQSLSVKNQKLINEKQINVFVVNIEELKANHVLKDIKISEFHACFLSIKKDLFYDENSIDLNGFIYKVNTSAESITTEEPVTFDNTFNESLLGKLLAKKGNDVPVSLLPVDGTYPTNTSQFNPIQKSTYLPNWNTDLCTQCGACSMACPQAALRIKVYDDTYLNDAPKTFKHITSEDFDLMNYTILINPEQCNGCNNCVDACSVKALNLVDKNDKKDENKNWNYFETIPEFDRTKIDVSKVSQQQLQEPLFKYSSGVEGCGEAPYLKLMSQLFGDRLLIANATGASSIFGGALPTTPWAKNEDGQGPAWSNSLFEDNAEFGLGFRMSLNQQEKQATYILKKLKPELNPDLVEAILNTEQTTELEIAKQRKNIELLNKELLKLNSNEAKQLLNISDNLVKKSVWIVGGDGWAYDIGYGGLDHVIASGENVNILVLDNEVYDNTGAQTSKATPFGAEAKFAFNGKQKQKKDLGCLAMTYDNVYVASVAIGANQEQTLKAFNEAENFDGTSIIIAYTHSESHGIDMKQPSKYHKAAVDSGQWLLYRNDPRREEKRLNTLQLDSNAASIKIQEYLKLEKRFSKLMNSNPNEFNSSMKALQKQVNNRFDKYLAMSLSDFKINRNKLLQDNKIKQQLKYIK
ncbi:pyruvate:ferredoxin (flavodoxin) oxidoreductase [Algibacter marinivivus]|uniref:Pyruvate:ferredoxin (Flavodoxin) oxidoreductase n=1 Tax=Algibacter marinivivus TaxID=2100723 RepID=A0A2U2X4K1_9FLAO|nr:4Fe-4S binding protein [Algibacter marinivivus]PWH82713.1 pyruvate:ferredoxin (flavodoxin) oxidoreductase [Algibacter marinivivus]